MTDKKPTGFRQQECIFIPIKLDKKRDDRRGFGYGAGAHTNGFSAQVEEEECEMVEIVYGNSLLPSDEEIKELKAKNAAEAEKEQEKKSWFTRLMAWIGLGG